MVHEIDLSKYEVRTDLLIESLNDSRLGKIDTKTRNIDDIIGTLTAIADVQVERAKKAFMQETAMGGVPTKTTSQALKDAWDFTFKLKELYDETNIEKPVTIQHTKVSGGSIETTTVRGKNPEQGGILEKIFFKDAIDVDAQVL
mgnify:CR=1 FL=1